MVEMNGWEMSLSWSKRGIWGRRGGRWWSGGGVNCHETSSLGFRGVPLSPVVPLSPCPLVRHLPLNHYITTSNLSDVIFLRLLNISILKKNIPLSSNRHPSLKEMKWISIVSYPFEFVIMKNVVMSWLCVVGWDEMRWGKQGNVQYWLLGSFWWLGTYLRVL